MRLTIAYSKIKRNLVLVNKDAYQRETLTKWQVRLLEPYTTSRTIVKIKQIRSTLKIVFVIW